MTASVGEWSHRPEVVDAGEPHNLWAHAVCSVRPAVARAMQWLLLLLLPGKGLRFVGSKGVEWSGQVEGCLVGLAGGSMPNMQKHGPPARAQPMKGDCVVFNSVPRGATGFSAPA